MEEGTLEVKEEEVGEGIESLMRKGHEVCLER